MTQDEITRLLIILAISMFATGSVIVMEPLFGISTGVSYTVAISIGSSQNTTYQLLLDTGSSNTAVATTTCCTGVNELSSLPLFNCAASTTCVSKSTNISVKYVSSSWTGHVVQDIFAIDSLEPLPDVSFVGIDVQSQFFRGGFGGILGVAFDSLAQPVGAPIPTFFQTLVNRQIVKNVFGLQLCGILQPYVLGLVPANVAGALGGITAPNSVPLFKGTIFYTPLIQAKWYVVLLTDIGYNNTSLGVNCGLLNSPKAIVDSGTTNLVLPTQAYRAVIAAIAAATLQILPEFASTYLSDRSVCCEYYCDPTNAKSPLLTLPPITISFAVENSVHEQITVTIPPTYYWRPIAVHSPIGTTTCRVMGISEGSSLILGNVFMDGLYIVHDRDVGRVGIAVADNCTNRVISNKTVTKNIISTSWCDCLSSSQLGDNLVTSKFPGKKTCFIWYWWTYVILVALIIVGICFLLLLRFWWLRRRENQRRATAPPALQEHLLVDGPMTPKEDPPEQSDDESRPPSVPSTHHDSNEYNL